MDLNQHTTPASLERYTFLWSLVRLPVAALALFIGGTPPVLYFNPVPALYGLLGSLLTVAWLISGFAALYLFYRWNKNKFMLFGGKAQLDVAAFVVCIVSGINLGLVGAIGQNIGMTISSNQIVFYVTGAVYLVSAYHLYTRWKAHGQKVF